MKLLQHVIRTILLTLLSWLPPDDRLIDDPPFRVAWDPERAHHCIFCLWTVLQYDGATWHCPQCSAQFQSLADTDPIASAIHQRQHNEKLAIGDLQRKVRDGEISYHGIGLQWTDTGERVNTAQLPRVRL